jgi:S-methylmethionine-dependent homocysteine/selenocysteine methylase
MMPTRTVEGRLADGEVLLLDGAVGTQLQDMGVPMHGVAWAAAALATHPYTVRRMHELYVKAGCDVVTTNTYSSARHNLEPLGMADATYELNLRAVMLARDACDRYAERPVAIAGAVSAFGLVTGGEPERTLHRFSPPRSAITAEQSREYLREQAEILAEAGVDLLLAEVTGSNEHREWVLEACQATGLPTWVGFRARLDATDAGGTVRTGHSSDTPLAESVETVMKQGGSVVSVFHSPIEATTAALPVVREVWAGAVAVYPDAGRYDYTAAQRDRRLPNRHSPEQFAEHAREWVEAGVQVVGGCCGYGLPYIRALREVLPPRVPTASVTEGVNG